MVALVVWLLLSCHTNPEVAHFKGKPSLKAPHPAPLALQAQAEAEDSKYITLVATAPGHTRKWRFDSNKVDETLYGLEACTEYELVWTAHGETGDDSFSKTFETECFEQPPDPPELAFKVKSIPGQMEPGWTIVPISAYGIFVLDEKGRVVWMYETDGNILECTIWSNGNFVFLKDRSLITELNWRGEIIDAWWAEQQGVTPPGATPVDVLAFHHDVQEFENGDLLAVNIEERIVPYPQSESTISGGLADTWVAGDIITRFTREGEIVQQWHLMDLLDTARIARDGINGEYWEIFRAFRRDDPRDWSHTNSLWINGDEIIVGMRHQDAIISLGITSGEINWIAAPHELWRPPLKELLLGEPLGDWFRHMHGSKLSHRGELILFDNGNHRGGAFQPTIPDSENYSRMVAYDISNGDLDETFSWGEQLKDHFSGSLGNVDSLENTENFLITFGNLKSPDLGGIRVVEVTRDKKVVFDLTVDRKVTSFRAHRVSPPPQPSLETP